MRRGIAPSCVLLVACAGGGETTPTLTSGPPADPTNETNDSTTGDSTTWAGGSTFDDSDDTTSTGDPDEESGNDSSSTGDGGEESDSDSSSSTGASVGECILEMTCLQGEILGGVSGDESSPPLTESGTEPMWFEFQVSENNDSVVGEALMARIRLDSTGGDFDLHAYLGDAGARSGCDGMRESSTSSGSSDTVSFSWGEMAVANNVDDGTFIAVEIVAKDDVCQPGASWDLTINGDM